MRATMTETKHNRKPAQKGAPGVKQLISATALAATLTGWALLTATQPADQAATTAVVGSQINVPPLVMPTLAPVATAAPLSLPTAGTAAERPQIVVQAPPAPTAAPAPAQPLRQVVVPAPPAPSFPFAPVARTRSSR